MTTTHDDDQALREWAADPSKWGKPNGTLTGADAAAAGRALMESAGVDVEELERRRGRPRLGPGQPGTRSPRVNASISPELDARLRVAEKHTGKDRSELVREALEHHLPHATVA